MWHKFMIVSVLFGVLAGSQSNAAYLHLRVTTDKDVYTVGDEVEWTIYAKASEGDNHGILSLEVSLDDNRSEAFNEALTVGTPPNEEFLDTEFGLSESFEVKRKGDPELTAPRLRRIKAEQNAKVHDVGNNSEGDHSEFYVFAKGSYVVTKPGPHDLNIFHDNSGFWITDIPDEYSMGQFTLGDNFPAYFSVTLKADIYKNLYVDLQDFAVLASKWMDDCGPGNDWCAWADTDKSTDVGFSDLEKLAQQWLMCVDPDEPGCDQYWQE